MAVAEGDQAERAPLRVVIAGGGIGGMALAAALHRGLGPARVCVTVFENDETFGTRRQGYGLTMQQGGMALRDLGLLDTAVREDTRTSSHYVCAPDGRIVGCFGRAMAELYGGNPDEKGKRHNLHLPRQRVRELLWAQIDPVCVQWGTRVVGFNQLASGGVAVRLDGGRPDQEADVLVGADGIHSAVRRCVLGADDPGKTYLGVLVVLGMAPCAHPFVRERIWQMVDGDTRLYAMPFSVQPDRTFWQLSFPAAEVDAVAWATDPAALAAEVRRRCGSWHAPVPALLDATSLVDITAYPVYDRPPLATPLSHATVTLMGDAAHTMSPFKGQGANQALLDGVELAAQLARTVTEGLPVCAALATFEASMIRRVTPKVLASRAAAARLHEPSVLCAAEEHRSTYRLSRAGLEALRAAGVGLWSAAALDVSLDALVVDTLRGEGLLPLERHAPRYLPTEF